MNEIYIFNTVNIWDKITLILVSYFTKHEVRSTFISTVH